MYEKFDKFATKILNSTRCAILIFAIGFVIACSLIYNVLDFQYATDKDYEPLYQTHQTIINDFNTVYTFSNTDIDITDSNIIVSIYGDDCYLKTYFDKTKVYQGTEQIDGTPPIWISITLLVCGSIASSAIFYLLVLFSMALIAILLSKLTKPKIYSR